MGAFGAQPAFGMPQAQSQMNSNPFGANPFPNQAQIQNSNPFAQTMPTMPVATQPTMNQSPFQQMNTQMNNMNLQSNPFAQQHTHNATVNI